MRMFRAFFIVALVASTGFAQAAGEKITRSERFSLFIGGERVGRMVAVDKVTKTGQIELLRESDLAFKRSGVEVRVVSRSTSVFDKNLRPLRFHFQREEPGGIMSGAGVVKGVFV